MSKSYIPAAMRRTVKLRAEGRCEYCLYPEMLAFFSYHIDHIIAEKHGGSTSLDNLALACPICNKNKGSDIASLDPNDGELSELFNPRIDRWQDHFELLEDGLISPRSRRGRVTVRLLQLNREERLHERRELVAAGLLPVEFGGTDENR